MSETVDMRLDQLDLVREVLRRHLPLHTRVFAFGSRTCGRAGRFSDLDLALDAGAPLASGTMLTLREEFEESDLPYPVDLVDWHAACHGVRKFVRRASVLLPPAAASPTASPPRARAGATLVPEAADLQQDPMRAAIQPYTWILHQSVDPL